MRPLCKDLNKLFYDVTFAYRFSRGKQMTACEPIRLLFYLVLPRLARKQDKAFSACQKCAYIITVSSDPGLHRVRCCTAFDRNKVMVFASNVSCIVVYLLVRCASENRHMGLHKGVHIRNICLPVCGFTCMLGFE